MIRAQGRSSPNPIRYLFVDGAYLDILVGEMSKKVWGVPNVPIDFQKLGSA
jgi:hypothetical protein